MKPLLAALLGSALALPAVAEPVDLDALIAAAKTEPPITIYDSTGKIVEQAQAFAAKYGLKANGIKAKATEVTKIVTAEAAAGNVQADVVILPDAPAAIAQLLEPGHVTSYLPDDLAANIPAIYRDPLVLKTEPNVFTYNTALNAACPVSNIWQLTLPEWKGHVALQDPLGKPSYTDWFNQMATHHDGAVRAAYKAQFGTDLKTDYRSATEAWVAALAANQPLLTDSDSAASEAVGAPDAKENFVGLVSTAKYRENANGMKLGLCGGLEPFAGWLYPAPGFVTTKSDSPNAARLFIHYMLTEEGFAPQAIDGKLSSNSANALPADEPSGLAQHLGEMMGYDVSTADADWQARQDWQDLWAMARAGH